MANEFDLSQLEKLSRPELIEDISENLRTLISAHEIQREPDSTETYLTFADFEDRAYAIPPSVRATLAVDSELESITVQISVNAAENAAQVEYMFSAVGANDNLVTIFVRDINGDYSADVVVDSDQDPLPLPSQPTHEEMTAFLASVFAPNKRGDYSIFANLDLHDVQVVRNLEEALKKYADWFNAEHAYNVDGPDKLNPYRIEYSVQDGSPASATIIEKLNNPSTALRLDFVPAPIDEDFDPADLEGLHLYELDQKGRSERIDATMTRLLGFDEFVRDLKSDFGKNAISEAATSRLDTVNPDPATEHMDTKGKRLRLGEEFRDLD